MRGKDFRMRAEITITADRTLYESVISLREPRTGGLSIAEDKAEWIDLARDLDIDARNIDRASTPRGSTRTEEGQ